MYYGINRKILGKISFNAKLRFMAGLPRSKCFVKCQFYPCQMLLFQAYEFAYFFQKSLCDVTGNTSV